MNSTKARGGLTGQNFEERPGPFLNLFVCAVIGELTLTIPSSVPLRADKAILMRWREFMTLSRVALFQR